VALLAEYDPTFAPHPATELAVAHASDWLDADVQVEWISTDAIDAAMFARCDGVWIAPGSPYRDLNKTLWAIRYAREHQIPCLGTCGGFQHMVLEYARNVLGFQAAHAEYEPAGTALFVTRLQCSLSGREMTLQFSEDSQIAAIYGGTSAREQYYCGFGINPDRVDVLKSGPLRVVGSDAEGEVRVVELPGHPFFIGTLYVPQMRSHQGRPHPLVSAFVRVTIERSGRQVPSTLVSHLA
jgi:CTP synthase (UTP-ammonia lyase)